MYLRKLVWAVVYHDRERKESFTVGSFASGTYAVLVRRELIKQRNLNHNDLIIEPQDYYINVDKEKLVEDTLKYFDYKRESD